MSGNSGRIIGMLEKNAEPLDSGSVEVLTVTEQMPTVKEIKNLLSKHDSFLVVSGNYWGSWSSSLQRFIEVVTAYENTPVFFGKPMACVISMDSVGGMDLAARLHSVFSGFGCWSPPCSTVVLSRTAQEAIAASRNRDGDSNEDVWRPSDIDFLVENLLVSEKIKAPWKAWPHLEFKIDEGAWPETGPIDFGEEPFL